MVRMPTEELLWPGSRRAWLGFSPPAPLVVGAYRADHRGHLVPASRRSDGGDAILVPTSAKAARRVQSKPRRESQQRAEWQGSEHGPGGDERTSHRLTP